MEFLCTLELTVVDRQVPEEEKEKEQLLEMSRMKKFDKNVKMDLEHEINLE